MKTEQSLIANYFENFELQSFVDAVEIPWFHGTHACNILEYQNPSDVIPKNIEAEDRRKIDIGLLQPVWFINEFGLYDLILNCRKPVAKPFKRWISHKVLPAIRKQGGYISESATLEQLEALEKENTKLKNQLTNKIVDYECFTDSAEGHPIVYMAALKKERDDLLDNQKLLPSSDTKKLKEIKKAVKTAKNSMLKEVLLEILDK